MILIDWARSLFKKRPEQIPSAGEIERVFNVTPAISRVMENNIELWYKLYTNCPPWENDCVVSLGLPNAIGRELARYTLSEFNVVVSGGDRAEYIDKVIQGAYKGFLNNLEVGLCLGGVAFRPYLERDRILIDVNSPTAFIPTEFDGTGRAIAGVFKETVTIGKEIYIRMEYQGFENGVYVIRNKAYRGTEASGKEVSLEAVPKWADLSPETYIDGLEKPLFSYFKNPSSNDIDPSSNVGVSVYGGTNVNLIQQADAQWEKLAWEYQSGERKVYSDGRTTSADQFKDRLFEYGNFTNEGNLFEIFSPEYRDEPLYRGFQHILQRIEYNVGLSFGTLSDPETVEKTATEILAAKNRQRITIKAIQDEFEFALDDLIYAVNAYCDLYGLAPRGEYEVSYNWGDGALDDPETIRQDKAFDLQLVNNGLMKNYEYRMKWFGEDEATAREMLTEAEPPEETVVEASE